MSDSVPPHRQQPTRLPRPWDSPGKNTGVGCHFLLQCTKVKIESEVVQSCWTQRPHGLKPARLLRPWDFPGKRVLEWVPLPSPVVVALGLSSCILQALEHWLNSNGAQLSCSAVHGISSEQVSRLCLLRWQTDSLP